MSGTRVATWKSLSYKLACNTAVKRTLCMNTTWPRLVSTCFKKFQSVQNIAMWRAATMTTSNLYSVENHMCQGQWELSKKHLMSNCKVITICSRMFGKVIAVMKSETAGFLLSTACKPQHADFLDSPSLRQQLLQVGKLYRQGKMMERYQSGQWSITEEIKKFHQLYSGTSGSVWNQIQKYRYTAG